MFGTSLVTFVRRTGRFVLDPFELPKSFTLLASVTPIVESNQSVDDVVEGLSLVSELRQAVPCSFPDLHGSYFAQFPFKYT